MFGVGIVCSVFLSLSSYLTYHYGVEGIPLRFLLGSVSGMENSFVIIKFMFLPTPTHAIKVNSHGETRFILYITQECTSLFARHSGEKLATETR